ncbi:unnamed protein product, partial [Rotaria magnacalcarata]
NNEPFNFVPRVQGGGGTVSVWGCMPGDACGSLIIYTGKMNGPAYIKTIQDALPIFIENKFDTWFKDNNINVLKWSASSRDLNPIENLWYYIDKEFKKSRPTNAGQLQTMIEDLWIGCYSNEM